jgi:predicted transcriptional regulator
VVENVLATFFEGSPRALMLNLLDSERLNPDEERRLRSLLEDGP